MPPFMELLPDKVDIHHLFCYTLSMIRQYGAQRFRPSKPMVAVETKKRGKKPAKTTWVPQADDFGYKYRVGVIPVGTIVWLQDNIRPFRGIEYPVRRDPWILTAWMNREYYPCVAGAPPVEYLSGGHLAIMKSLRNGREHQVSDWIIEKCIDAGLEMDYLTKHVRSSKKHQQPTTLVGSKNYHRKLRSHALVA